MSKSGSLLVQGIQHVSLLLDDTLYPRPTLVSQPLVQVAYLLPLCLPAQIPVMLVTEVTPEEVPEGFGLTLLVVTLFIH